jgi:hypothetical protein
MRHTKEAHARASGTSATKNEEGRPGAQPSGALIWALHSPDLLIALNSQSRDTECFKILEMNDVPYLARSRVTRVICPNVCTNDTLLEASRIPCHIAADISTSLSR